MACVYFDGSRINFDQQVKKAVAEVLINEFIFGGKIIPYFMNKIESIDIDDHEDWQLTELILNSKIFNNE